MKKLRILQLASFEGNIGDNANHNGTRYLLNENLKEFSLEFYDLEIREFFWKERKFNNEFAKLVNQYDLLIVGGGNYFELWVDDSCNGTSVNISIEILKKINTPIIFYALGLDPAQGVSENRIIKFKRWLDYVLFKDNYLVSVRNDGSMNVAIKLLGKEYSDKMHLIPDGGFFTKVKKYFHPEIPPEKTVIGINLAGDMLNIRFNKLTPNHISSVEFLKTLCTTLEKLLEENQNLHLVFYCHIYKDLKYTSEFLNLFNDAFCRKKITVAPYLHGKGSQEYLFDSYSQCDLIMGNRFHANVCAIGLGIPTIGFINYRQIKKLYEELGIENRAIEVNLLGFEKILIHLIRNSLENKNAIKLEYKIIKKKLRFDVDVFHEKINNWIIHKENIQ